MIRLPRVSSRINLNSLKTSFSQIVCCMCEGVMSSEAMSRALVSATNTASLVLPAVQEELMLKLKRKKHSENQK